jgi:hypothetical protein
MEDCDVQEAKKQYQIRQGKIFKHEMIYSILRRGLPKYEIVIATIHPRVARAFLLDNNIQLSAAASAPAGGHQLEGDNGNSNDSALPAARAFGTVPLENDIAADTSLLTPRASIGKRKAKEIAFAAAARNNKNTLSSIESKKRSEESKIKQKEKRDVVLTRLAEAAEAKNKFARERLLFQMYLQNPNSARAKAFFARMEMRYDSEEETEIAVPLVSSRDKAYTSRQCTTKDIANTYGLNGSAHDSDDSNSTHLQWVK